ncbi:hypothetical protein AB0J40_13995 [Amycolatopsis sp. NPDC049691]|uniref:hypothetical protein n=1 Tax=Amycolatopsis sp. NPDC049691 TaxID=3155155 RepID=UPI003438E95A
MENVFFERLRKTLLVNRNGPHDVTTMGQPPGFDSRAADHDDIVLVLASPNATVHIGFGQPRQGKEEITDVSGELVEQGPPVDVIPERKANLGVKAVRNVGGDGPGQPENGNIPVDPGGFPGQLGGEADPTTGRDDAGSIGNGANSGEANPEAADGVPGLPGGPQRGKGGNTPSVQGRTGVGEPKFPVHKGHPDLPGRPVRHGGIGGVLGKLDEEPIPIGTNAQIPFDVGVLDEPGGRVPPGAQGGLAEPRGAEGIGPGGVRDPAAHERLHRGCRSGPELHQRSQSQRQPFHRFR